MIFKQVLNNPHFCFLKLNTKMYFHCKFNRKMRKGMLEAQSKRKRLNNSRFLSGACENERPLGIYFDENNF